MTQQATVVQIVAAPNPISAAVQLGNDLAARVAAALRESGIHVEPRTVAVASHAQDLARVQLGALPGTALARDLRLIERAHAIIAVTQVFQASYSGLFKMIIDALDPDALAGTPTLLAACGATTAHTLVVDQVMRPLFGYLRAITVPTAVYLATGDASPESAARIDTRIAAAAAELAALVGR